MNLFYEDLPSFIVVREIRIPIITDFREYIRLSDMLANKYISSSEKAEIIFEYCLEDPRFLFGEDYDACREIITKLTDFLTMQDVRENKKSNKQKLGRPKILFSYSFDFPYILSAFLNDYGIDLLEVEYMHWWKFRCLFDGLSEENEIKKRIMYRGTSLNSIKDKKERARILSIQRKIEIPAQKTIATDEEIGNAFMM